MFRYGDRVVIRDGSMLDGSDGIVCGIKEGNVQVLLDREVFWFVAEHHPERAGRAGNRNVGHEASE